MHGQAKDDHVDESLSPRELQTLELAASGRTNGEIARDLGITVHAVKFHLASIYRKLGVTNRTEAAVKHLEARYLEAQPDRLEGQPDHIGAAH